MAKIIRIEGSIGSYIDEMGVEISGVQLVDVIAQAENAGGETEIVVEINSPGGQVDAGYAIYDYLVSLKASGKTITTKINGLCASIATVIALAGDKRQIIRGSKFLIHNPFINGVSGDAESMRQYADTLDTVEAGLAKFYSKVTGIGHAALALIMKEDKEITAEKALELKFVTEIVAGQLNPIKNLKIVAAIKQSNQNQNTMKTLIEQGRDALNTLTNLIAKAKKDTPVNVEMKTKDGKVLTMESAEVGKVVTVDGKPATSMTLELENGTIIKTDAEGKITEVTPVKEKETAVAKICENATMGDFIFNDKGELIKSSEITLANGKKLKTDAAGKVESVTAMAAEVLSPDQIITLKKENDDMKVTIAAMQKLQTETTEKIALLAKLGSTFSPEERKTILNKTKTAGAASESMSEDVRARREERRAASAKK